MIKKRIAHLLMTLTSPLICLAIVPLTAVGDTEATAEVSNIDSDIKNLTAIYQKISDTISKTLEADRPKQCDKLKEQVKMMAFNLGYYLDGGDNLNIDRSDKVLVDFIYAMFRADQGHLERSIKHTQESERAVAAMPNKARCLIALYPVRQPASTTETKSGSIEFEERIYFVQYLMTAYVYIPDKLVEIIRLQLPRWKSEERLPGLLILSESGDAEAQKELDGIDSIFARKMKLLSRSFFDFEKKHSGK